MHNLIQNKTDELRRDGYKIKKTYSKKDVKLFVDLFLDAVSYSLQKDEITTLNNFGTFKVKNVRERQILNPKTKKTSDVKGQSTVSFRPGKPLKDAVNHRINKNMKG